MTATAHQPYRHLTRFAILGAILLFGSPARTADEVSVLITPAGGVIASLDGSVVFAFPQGAVAEDTLITLSVVSGGGAPPVVGEWFGPVYSLAPDGLPLLAPVTATFSFGPEVFAPPDGKEPPPPNKFILIPWRGGDGSWTPVPASQTIYDLAGGATLSVGLTALDSLGLVLGGNLLSSPPDGKEPPPPNATPPAPDGATWVARPFPVEIIVQSLLDPATEGYLLAPITSSGLPFVPYASWPVSPAGGDDALAISADGVSATGSHDFVCLVEGSGEFGGTVTVGFDFAQYLPIGLDIAWPAAIDCLSPPTATVDVDARVGELDADADGLLDPSADLNPDGTVAPLAGGSLVSPPDGTPPTDLDALWNLSGGGFAWTPLPGLCTAALWGLSPTVVDVVVVTVTTATVDTVYEISGDFVSGLIFPGAAGDGWIRAVTVAFPDGGAAILAFAATACP